MSDPRRNRAWVEVDPTALRHNYAALVRAAGPRSGVLVMVKADAYGLGARWVVETLEPLRPKAYGVAAVSEGIALREWGVTREILVCTPMPPDDVERAAAHGLTATISHPEALRRWAEAGRRHEGLRFHVNVDTGMGRAGLLWSERSQWLPEIVALAGEHCRWTGVYTHFHSADVADPASAAEQWARFQQTLSDLPVARESLVVHASNSAATLRFPHYALDQVRTGIFLYGGDPAEGAGHERPRPVASVRARVVLVRDVPAGTTVGYGATHVASGPARWATLAIGYGDGLPRSLGNRGHALLHGRRVPIIGRISMDLTVVDITGLDRVAPGDVATLLGRDGGEEIAVEEVAGLANTISYEILTGFTPRLPRLERENE